MTRKNREAALNLRYQEEGLGGGAESRPLFAEAEQRAGHLAIVLAIRNSGKHLLVPPVSGRVWSTRGERDGKRLEGRGLVVRRPSTLNSEIRVLWELGQIPSFPASASLSIKLELFQLQGRIRRVDRVRIWGKGKENEQQRQKPLA